MSKQQNKPTGKQPVKKTAAATTVSGTFLFARNNYIILLAGLLLMALGFVLMSGGSQPPDQFDESEIYSFRRTTLSALTVFIGLLVILYSIFAKPKEKA